MIMCYYVIPLTLWYFYVAANFLKKGVKERIASVFFLPLVFIVGFRGDVGTDTANYIQEFGWKVVGANRPFGEFEPGFEFIASLLGYIVANERFVVNSISVINAGLFFLAVKKWGGSQLVAAACLVPCFFFDFTMNGLRIGSAFPLCVMSAIFFKKEKYLISFFLLIAAVSCQMTAIFLFPLLVIDEIAENISVKNFAVGLLGGLIMGLIFYEIFSERVLVKFALYEVAESPGGLSGSIPILISLFLTAPFFMQINLLKRPMQFFALQIIFFQLTSVSYAGIRFQLLSLFAQILFTQKEVLKLHIWKNMAQLYCLLIFIFCVAWKIRAYMTEGDDGQSPFLPYQLFLI